MIRSYAYFTPALLLLLLEMLIGRYAHDNMIRPYGGDFLVVILLYCLVKSFFNVPPVQTAILVLLFAYAVEISQYFHLITLLRLQHSKTATLLLGSSFSWLDLLSNTLGIALVILVEKLRPDTVKQNIPN